jgi:hypothetical protein
MSTAVQLKNQLDIIAVIGEYITLKKSGQRHIGLCPFHSEETPSFKVHAERQRYTCFGCGAAGDVFTFVQRMENLTFPKTLNLLAERHGIVVSNATLLPRRPKLTPAECNTANQFVIALVWYVEELLVEHKTRMWEAFDFGLPLQDSAPLFSEPVRDLTAFLAELQRWTPAQACEALGKFRVTQPALTNDMLAETEAQQALVAAFIHSLAPAERAA